MDPHWTHAPSLAVTAALSRRHAGVQYGFVRLRTVAQIRQRDPLGEPAAVQAGP